MELRQSFINVSLLRMHVTYWAPVYQLTIIIGNFRWKIPITTLPFVCWSDIAWWRHQMKTFSASLTLCAGSWPLICEFPYKDQWRGALMVFYLHLNKRLRKYSKSPWFDTSSRLLWRYCKGLSFEWSSYLHTKISQGTDIIRSARQGFTYFT